MQESENELIEWASAQLDRLTPYVAAEKELRIARDLARATTYRAIGPCRAANSMQRLATISERVQALLEC